MSTVVLEPEVKAKPEAAAVTVVEPFLTVTEKAASEVKSIIAQQLAAEATLPPEEQKANGQLYLRVRVVGGGCSGFQNKLDLEPVVNAKTDEIFHVHGISVVVDKRSKLYLVGAMVDFHDDLNKRGFSITNPQAKSTCGCGSSFSM